MDTFSLVLTLAAVLAVGLALGAVIGVRWARSRPADDTAPYSALDFEIMTDTYGGHLTFIRLYSVVMT